MDLLDTVYETTPSVACTMEMRAGYHRGPMCQWIPDTDWKADDTPIITYAPRQLVHTIRTATPILSGPDPTPYVEPAPFSQITTIPAPVATTDLFSSLPSWVWIAGAAAVFLMMSGGKRRR